MGASQAWTGGSEDELSTHAGTGARSTRETSARRRSLISTRSPSCLQAVAGDSDIRGARVGALPWSRTARLAPRSPSSALPVVRPEGWRWIGLCPWLEATARASSLLPFGPCRHSRAASSPTAKRRVVNTRSRWPAQERSTAAASRGSSSTTTTSAVDLAERTRSPTASAARASPGSRGPPKGVPVWRARSAPRVPPAQSAPASSRFA
jgi:hypothetical protein